MERITADQIREVISDPDPVLEALSMMLKDLARDLVEALTLILASVGADARDLPAEYLIQAVLVETSRALKPVSRENWVKIYDSYEQVKAVLEANPDLKAEVNDLRHKSEKSTGSLLDGNF